MGYKRGHAPGTHGMPGKVELHPHCVWNAIRASTHPYVYKPCAECADILDELAHTPLALRIDLDAEITEIQESLLVRA